MGLRQLIPCLAFVAMANAFSPALLAPNLPVARSGRLALSPSRGLRRLAMDASADGQGQPAIILARGAAISHGPPQSQEQYGQYQEQPNPRGELQMEKGGVSTMVLVSGSVAALAGGYFGVKKYKQRQQDLVEEFAYSMMLYWGDMEGTKANVKEYLGRVGPFNTFHKADMFREYSKKLASDKPLGANSIGDFRNIKPLLGVSNGAIAKQITKAAEELVPYTDPTETWERNANKPSVLGKLLWLTERCHPDPATIAKIRARFPKSYGDEVIDVLQKTLTEEAYKAIIEAAGGCDAGLQPGFEVLGLSKADAQQVVDRLIQEKEKAEEDAARIAAEKAEEERVLNIRKAAMDGVAGVKTHGETEEDREKQKKKVRDSRKEPERAEGSHEYECTLCGFTLFVAKGREFKFFGDDFKCGQCGAGKSYFKDNAAVQ